MLYDEAGEEDDLPSGCLWPGLALGVLFCIALMLGVALT